MSKMKNHKINDLGSLIISIIISEGVGFVAGAITSNSKAYYLMLHKPSFSPPPLIFTIVWPILYFLMAIASYKIWIRGKAAKSAINFYVVQLILNFLWPIIFFRLNLYGIAFIELIILIVFVILCIISFFKYEKKAAFFMCPYLIWLVYAAVLNYFIWILNEA